MISHTIVVLLARHISLFVIDKNVLFLRGFQDLICSRVSIIRLLLDNEYSSRQLDDCSLL